MSVPTGRNLHKFDAIKILFGAPTNRGDAQRRAEMFRYAVNAGPVCRDFVQVPFELCVIQCCHNMAVSH